MSLASSLSTHKRAVALVAIASVAVGYGVLGIGRSSKPSFTLNAQFTDASPLIAGNEVKIGGVKVGKVTKIKLIGGKAEVEMSLSSLALPVHTDARAMVRPVTLLGERYVELNRGSASAPVIQSGQLLSSDHTGQSTGLDQVLNTLDDPTGTGLAGLVATLGEGVDGNGKNIAGAIKALAPVMRDTTRLAQILDEQNALLTSTIDSVGGVAGALADNHGRTLDALVRQADELLGTTSSNDSALRQMLAELPDTLRTARTSLASLTGTARAAAPTLQSARPVTDNLSTISDELARFADAADPALASAAPVLAKARTLLEQAQPVAAALQAAGPSVQAVAHSARPLVRQVTNKFDDVMNFLKNWALTTNAYDGLSHYFRVEVVVTPMTVTGMVPGVSGNLGVGGDPPPPGQPGQPAPLLPNLTLPSLNSILGILSPAKTSDGGVTGLTPSQEQGGLLSLLGLGGL